MKKYIPAGVRIYSLIIKSPFVPVKDELICVENKMEVCYSVFSKYLHENKKNKCNVESISVKNQ